MVFGYLVRFPTVGEESKETRVVSDSPKKAIESILHYHYGFVPSVIKWSEMIVCNSGVLVANYKINGKDHMARCEMCVEDRVKLMYG